MDDQTLRLPQDQIPPDQTVLWRYMDFARFVQLLENQTLWFARADTFEDPLEGTYSDGERSFSGWLNSLLLKPREPKFEIACEGIARACHVNCWRAGDSESLAMWDLYGKGSGVVAIKTTVGNLKEQLGHGERTVHLAAVRYIDMEANDICEVEQLILRKDVSYQHEQEVRAFIPPKCLYDLSRIIGEAKLKYEPLIKAGVKIPDDGDRSLAPFLELKLDAPRGLDLKVDVRALLEEVMIGPREKIWVQELVVSLLQRYGYDVPVRSSKRLQKRTWLANGLLNPIGEKKGD